MATDEPPAERVTAGVVDLVGGKMHVQVHNRSKRPFPVSVEVDGNAIRIFIGRKVYEGQTVMPTTGLDYEVTVHTTAAKAPVLGPPGPD